MNYSRAIMVMKRDTDDDVGAFKLIGAKRGKRIGWEDAEGKRMATRRIAYSDGYLFWRDAPKDASAEVSVGRKKMGNQEADGKALAEIAKAEPMTRTELRDKARAMFKKNAGDRAYNWLLLTDENTHQPMFKTLGLTEGKRADNCLAIGLAEALSSIS